MDTQKNLYLVMIALLTINFGCAPPPVVKDKPGPRIPGVNLTGDWYSPEFGIMELKQDGVAVLENTKMSILATVTGTFEPHQRRYFED